VRIAWLNLASPNLLALPRLQLLTGAIDESEVAGAPHLLKDE
jgi:hypothetical protein